MLYSTVIQHSLTAVGCLGLDYGDGVANRWSTGYIYYMSIPSYCSTTYHQVFQTEYKEYWAEQSLFENKEAVECCICQNLKSSLFEVNSLLLFFTLCWS